MKKLTALSLALLLALFPAAAGALAMEQLHPPAQTESPDISQEEPEGETTSTQPEAPEGETTSMQSEEELPVWTEVSTIDALCAAGGSAGHIRLTADLIASDPDLQFHTLWTPTTLDMNGHHIQIEEGGWLSFGGGSTPVVILDHGGEEGAFRVLSGGRLELGDVDASRLTGLLARQAEGGCLVVSEVTAQPEQIAYAQAPVLYQLRASFAALPLGLSQEELAAQLPEPEVFVNYQGQMSMMLSIPADRLSWDIEENWEDISAGRRTVLHARPNGPISGEGWPESGLTPTLFAPVSC